MGEFNPRAQLLEVVRQVRRRWRLKLALRGAVGFLIAGIVAIVAIAYALEALKFTPAAIFWFRIATGLVLVAAGAWFFARPLSRKVTDEQVVLYLEEHEPSLDSTILSAMPRSTHAAMVGLIVVFSALGGTTGSLIVGQIFAATGGSLAFYLLLVPIAGLAVAIALLPSFTLRSRSK